MINGKSTYLSGKCFLLFISRKKHVSSFSFDKDHGHTNISLDRNMCLPFLSLLPSISSPSLFPTVSSSFHSLSHSWAWHPGKIFASFLFLYIKSLFLLNFLCMLVKFGIIWLAFCCVFVLICAFLVCIWEFSPLSRSIRDPPSQRFISVKISFPFLTPRNLVLGNGHSVCVTNCK